MSDNKAQLLEIYKLHAELADKVSQRREGANRLHAGMLIAFLVATISIIRWNSSNMTNTDIAWISIISGVSGIGICVSWVILISSYRKLNRAKYTVLQEIEAQLDFAFFTKEWCALGEGNSITKYIKITVAELIPIVILFLVYGLVFTYGICQYFMR